MLNHGRSNVYIKKCYIRIMHTKKILQTLKEKKTLKRKSTSYIQEQFKLRERSISNTAVGQPWILSCIGLSGRAGSIFFFFSLVLELYVVCWKQRVKHSNILKSWKSGMINNTF